MATKDNKSQYSVIILAAGKGTRMRNQVPKLMHKIAGEYIINYPVELAKNIGAKEIVAVVNNENVELNQYIKEKNVSLAYQNDQLGTAHAVKTGAKALKLDTDYTIILFGDTPLIQLETLESGLGQINSSAMVFAFVLDTPNQYGKLNIENGYVTEIIEYFDYKDNPSRHCNSGLMIVKSNILLDYLDKIENNNAKSEYYLTDLVGILSENGHKCEYFVADYEEFCGINSQKERVVADKILQQRIIDNLLNSGVIIFKPETSYFDYDISIEPGVEIEANVHIGKGSNIHSGAKIRSFSYLEDCIIRKNAVVGPFARVRTKSDFGEDVHVGSFVETKNAKLSYKTKANHLSYLGDIEIGKEVNVGAGTIICNYDGINKYQSKVDDNVFIGSNSCIISPINIAAGSIIAAGTVVTKSVEPDTVVIARPDEKHLINKAKLFKESKKPKSAK